MNLDSLGGYHIVSKWWILHHFDRCCLSGYTMSHSYLLRWIFSYVPNPVLVIIDVQPKELGIPTKAYYDVEEVKEVWFHVISFPQNVWCVRELMVLNLLLRSFSNWRYISSNLGDRMLPKRARRSLFMYLQLLLPTRLRKLVSTKMNFKSPVLGCSSVFFLPHNTLGLSKYRCGTLTKGCQGYHH